MTGSHECAALKHQIQKSLKLENFMPKNIPWWALKGS